MTYRTHPKIAMLLVIASSGMLAWCTSNTTSPGANPDVGALVNSAPLGETLKICKNGNVDGTFTLNVTNNTGGSSNFTSPVTVAQGTCQTVLTAGGPGANVTIHETSAGFVSATAQGLSGSVAYTDNSTSLLIASGSGFTVTYTNNVSTSSGCTFTQGYWKTHADAWPVTSLQLGTTTYTQAQLLSILNTPVQGNGLISLAYQLIAAKLNVAAGASPAPAEIAQADALIGSLVIPPVGSGSLAPSATSALTSALASFNEGTTGPGHCP